MLFLLQSYRIIQLREIYPRITVERITGNVNHGNRENESLWDYREGESKQLRSL